MDSSTVPIMRHRSAPQSGARDDRDSDGPLMGSPSTVQMGSAFNYNNNTRSSNSFRNQYDGTSPYKFRNHSRPTSKISAFFAAGYGDGDDGDQSQRWKNLLALAVGFLLLVAPWMRHVQVQWKVRTLQTDLEQLQHQQRQLQKEVRNQITTLQTIKTDAADYKQRNDELLGNLKARGDEYDDFDAAAYREAEEMEERYFKRVDELEREIQRAGARQLVHAGHGVLGSSAPVRAVVTLAAPPATTTTTTEVDGGDDSVRSRQQLVLELAPAHTYSHAVAYFWDMVQRRRVYDRWTLMRSAGNGGGSVLYTVPMDYETKRMTDFDGTMGHFEMSREDGSVRNDGAAVLDKLAVLEHPQVESDYPIEKYSGESVG